MRVLRDMIRYRASVAFDRWASSYDADVQGKLRRRGYSYEELGATISCAIGAVHDGAVLELGVGTGVLGRSVRAEGVAQIIGIDISRGMLEQARGTGTYHMLLHCSAESIPIRSGSFGALYSAFMLHSVPDQRAAVAEMARLLRPGASGCLVDLYPQSSRSGFISVLRWNLESVWKERGALSLYRHPDQVVEMLEEAGLIVTGRIKLGKPKRLEHVAITFHKAGAK